MGGCVRLVVTGTLFVSLLVYSRTSLIHALIYSIASLIRRSVIHYIMDLENAPCNAILVLLKCWIYSNHEKRRSGVE